MSGRDILLVAVALAIGATAVTFWYGRGSYEECVVEELRGQSHQKAILAVTRLCRQRYPIK